MSYSPGGSTTGVSEGCRCAGARVGRHSRHASGLQWQTGPKPRSPNHQPASESGVAATEYLPPLEAAGVPQPDGRAGEILPVTQALLVHVADVAVGDRMPPLGRLAEQLHRPITVGGHAHALQLEHAEVVNRTGV